MDPERSVLRLAASLDRAAREGIRVRETAELHDLSERSLRRLSNRLFGYGPKTLMQIHRFKHALHLARAGMPLSRFVQASCRQRMTEFLYEYSPGSRESVHGLACASSRSASLRGGHH